MNAKALLMNKQILLALGMIVFAGAVLTYGTGAFFSSSASATANVFQAGTLSLKIAKDSNGVPVGGWLDSQVAPWNFSNLVPGGTPQVSAVWLKNVGSIGGMHLGIAGANSIISGPNLAPQLRISTLTLDGQNLLQGGAGAAIGAYVAPNNCTVTLSGSDTITNAIAAASNGDVICASGTDYNAGWEGVSTILVNKEVTIESVGGPSVTKSIPFDVTASNVTIRGFEITDPTSPTGIVIHGGVSNVSVMDNNIHDIATSLTAANYQGVYLEGDATNPTSHFVFSGNTVNNIGSATNNHSDQGIYIGDTAHHGPIFDVTVSNNVISNVLSQKGAYGFEVNEAGGVSGLVVMNNSIFGLDGGWAHAVGLEGDTPNASVTKNDIHDLTSAGNDAVAVQVETPNASAASIVINQNNLTPNVAVGINNTTGIDVNGQNNWWGDQDPSDQVSANVNTYGFLGGAVAGLINGTDYNNNGYADLQDLAQTPLVGGQPGIDAGQQRKLVMAVQLDGPTTDNSFQGAGLNTDLTFTLSQQ